MYDESDILDNLEIDMYDIDTLDVNNVGIIATIAGTVTYA
jgi:hypothetical protein